MTIATGWKVAGLAALGIGVAAAVAGCTRTGGGDGPMGELTTDLMRRLVPNAGGSLDVATQSKQVVRNESGGVQGTYDGTRLLVAADAHAYGTPTILDAAKDVQNDGRASFNEIRHVVRHFDVDASNVWDQAEARAFEAEVGIRWIPGT